MMQYARLEFYFTDEKNDYGQEEAGLHPRGLSVLRDAAYSLVGHWPRLAV